MKVIKFIFKAINSLVFWGINKSFPNMNRSNKSFVHFFVFVFLGYWSMSAWIENHPWLWIVVFFIAIGFVGEAWSRIYKQLPDKTKKKEDITKGIGAAPKNRSYVLNSLSAKPSSKRKKNKKIEKRVRSRRKAKIIRSDKW